MEFVVPREKKSGQNIERPMPEKCFLAICPTNEHNKIFSSLILSDHQKSDLRTGQIHCETVLAFLGSGYIPRVLIISISISDSLVGKAA